MKAFPASLLKHKWTFVLVTAVCWTVAAGYFFLANPPWVSEAKLMVAYIISRDDLDRTEGTNKLELIMRGEMDILTSRDVADKVVAEIGADRLAPGKGETEAASIMANGLTVEHENGTSVMCLTFRHAEAETAQATLNALIKQYIVKHLQIHRPAGSQGRSTAEVEVNRLTRKPETGIRIIQEPTPGIQDVTRCNQILAGLYAGGPVLGLLAVMIRSAPARRSSAGDGRTGDEAVFPQQ